MPSLREPLEHVTTCYKAFGEAFCALVEAVGVVEEKETLVAAHELAESNAERERLARKWGEADVKIDQLRTDLAEAKTNIAGLLDSVRWWKQQLVEAKAEIARVRVRLQRERDQSLVVVKRLRQQRDVAETQLGELERGDSLEQEREYLKAERATLAADADLGQLVRNMENETGIHYRDGQYYALRFGWKAPRTMGYVPIADSKSENPTAALRAIQEMGDDEV